MLKNDGFVEWSQWLWELHLVATLVVDHGFVIIRDLRVHHRTVPISFDVFVLALQWGPIHITNLLAGQNPLFKIAELRKSAAGFLIRHKVDESVTNIGLL